jgi:hypothetical protein
MITWFYSKFAIYIFSILVFMALLAILYDFMTSEVFLKNVTFAKYVMFMHYAGYLDQASLASRIPEYSIVLTANLAPRKLKIVCYHINCTASWSYLGTPANVSFLVPKYYNDPTTIYAPGSTWLKLVLSPKVELETLSGRKIDR